MKFSHVRGLFPIVKNTLYFDAASLSPYCVPVVKALEKFGLERQNYASTYFEKWYEEVGKGRNPAAKLLNASPGEIAFTKNTTEGINFTARMVDWRKGDEVFACETDFPTNVYPFMNLQRKGVKVRFINCGDGALTRGEIEKALNPRTRLITLSHVSYNSGYRLNLREIGEMCRENNVLFHVDAAQSMGAFRIDVKKANIDFLSACGFKWLLSPIGTGVFYVKKEHLLNAPPPVLGWLSVKDYKRLKTRDFELLNSAKRLEAGTLNVGGFLGMKAALGLIHEIGLQRIEKRILELSLKLGEEMEMQGIKILSHLEKEHRSGIICVEKKGIKNQFLKKRRIVATLRNNLRFSPHIYNNEEDIGRLVEVIALLKKQSTARQ